MKNLRENMWWGFGFAILFFAAEAAMFVCIAAWPNTPRRQYEPLEVALLTFVAVEWVAANFLAAYGISMPFHKDLPPNA